MNFPTLLALFLLWLCCLWLALLPKLSSSLTTLTVLEHAYNLDEYTLLEIIDFLTPDECRAIQDMSLAQGMKPSTVVNADFADQDFEHCQENRTSHTAWISNLSAHPVINKINRRTAQLSGYPASHQEELQVVRYETGGKFDMHYDAFDISCALHLQQINRGAKQRKFTLLMYLNDDYENGITEFVNMQLEIRPQMGKAIFFSNTDADDNILFLSAHCGHPVTKGEKWICTKWIHPLPYPC
jgi:prolyl 4-hydroxylase